MRVGLLTGGGDAPGLNAVIRAVVRVGVKKHGHEHIGLRRGWRGLMEGTHVPLDLMSTSGILPRGGTIIGTSRTNPYRREGGPEKAAKVFRELGLDALVAIGGEDTLGVALRLHRDFGLPIVGVPKTIDNDLSATDYTFGFNTAVQIVTDAIDRLHTTAESHDRVMIVEVMGRHAGWIALYSGLAGGADAILVPERPASVDEVVGHILTRHHRGKDFSIIVVSEGVEIEGDPGEEGEVDEFGHKRLAQAGVADRLALHIRDRTGFDTRVTVLGHVQRGGTPTAQDRILATRFGSRASDLVAKGGWGHMVALRGQRIVEVPLEDAVEHLKTVPDEVYEIASPFFG